MIIKEGTYIRTKNGKIDKVIDDYNGHCSSPTCQCKHILCLHDYYDEDEIKSFSDDVFDLLEDGDYVNGLQIHRLIIKNHSIVKGKIFHSFSYDSEDGSVHTYVFTKDGGYPIKSIVTKEMFEEVKFDVCD